MKTRKAVFLGVALLMVVSLMLPLGCVTDTETETTYKEVAVGTMTLSIPTDWQRPEDYEEFVEEVFTGFTEEESQLIQVDAYEDKSEDAFIALMAIDMVESYELMGLTWRGWDIELGEAGRTTEEFAESMQWSVTAGFTELTREVHRQLTVGGREAWGTTYTAKAEGEPVQVCLLVIFAPNDAGMLLMVVEQAEWEKFEGTWEKIRDSVQF